MSLWELTFSSISKMWIMTFGLIAPAPQFCFEAQLVIVCMLHKRGHRMKLFVHHQEASSCDSCREGLCGLAASAGVGYSQNGAPKWTVKEINKSIGERLRL